MKNSLFKIIIYICGAMYLANTSVFAHNTIMDNYSPNSSHHHDDINDNNNINAIQINNINDKNNFGCENSWCKNHCYNIENSKITIISNKLSLNTKNTPNIIKSENIANIPVYIYSQKSFLAKYIYDERLSTTDQKFIKFADLIWVIVLIC